MLACPALEPLLAVWLGNSNSYLNSPDAMLTRHGSVRTCGGDTRDLRLIKARVLINLPRGAPRKTGSVTNILKRSLARFARNFFGPN
jgi:hypothetical protein